MAFSLLSALANYIVQDWSEYRQQNHGDNPQHLLFRVLVATDYVQYNNDVNDENNKSYQASHMMLV